MVKSPLFFFEHHYYPKSLIYHKIKVYRCMDYSNLGVWAHHVLKLSSSVITIWHPATTCSLNCTILHALIHGWLVILQKPDCIGQALWCKSRKPHFSIFLPFLMRFRKMLVHLMLIIASLAWIMARFNLIFWWWRICFFFFLYLRSAGKFLSHPPFGILDSSLTQAHYFW